MEADLLAVLADKKSSRAGLIPISTKLPMGVISTSRAVQWIWYILVPWLSDSIAAPDPESNQE
jgi:hypothetical protein